jgi:hypothetical protein
MTERQFRKLEAEIARYRLLEREVTDPLAASLIHVIISESRLSFSRVASQSASSPGQDRLKGPDPFPPRW